MPCKWLSRLFLALRTAIALTACIVSFNCSARKAPRAITPSIGTRQTGIASWYGHPYHGRATASGEIYDMNLVSAAHRRFTFGTWVRVDNLDNGKRTEVRINDRGPFVRGRIIDLSRAAADRIGMIAPGTAKVKLTVIAPPRRAPTSLPSRTRWGVQVASFRDERRAESLSDRLRQQGRTVSLQQYEEWTRVVVLAAGESSEAAARELLEELRRGYPQAAIFSTEIPQP